VGRVSKLQNLLPKLRMTKTPMTEKKILEKTADDSSNGDDGDDDGAEAISEHGDSSPKVDITG
jgi:hypothetical protein